jgi:hypothetical protein
VQYLSPPKPHKDIAAKAIAFRLLPDDIEDFQLLARLHSRPHDAIAVIKPTSLLRSVKSAGGYHLGAALRTCAAFAKALNDRGVRRVWSGRRGNYRIVSIVELQRPLHNARFSKPGPTFSQRPTKRPSGPRHVQPGMPPMMMAMIATNGNRSMCYEEVEAVHRRTFNLSDKDKSGKLLAEEIQDVIGWHFERDDDDWA